MFKKKKMAAEIVRLRYRVQELEERLCPCEQHQWIVIDKKIDFGSFGDITNYYIYKCRRCGKTKRTWLLLPEWRGSDAE